MKGNTSGWVDGVPFWGSTANVPYDLIEVTRHGDIKPQFIAGLPVAYRESLNLWECHYCGSVHHAELHKCPNCGGERR